MKSKLVITILLISILIYSLISVSAESNKTYSLTDPVTDLNYEAEINDKTLQIKHGSEILGETYIQNISTCTIYNNILYIYYADNLNQSLLVYCFDFYSDNIISFAVNEDAFYNENCFTSDGELFYFVSGKDTKKLCVYENGYVRKIDLKSQIKKLLLINKSLVIVITSDSTFIYNDSNLIEADCTLSPYIKYIGDGIIKDASGKEYYIENGNLVELIPETTVITTTKAKHDSPANFTDGFYIAQQGNTVSQIKKAFADIEFTKFAKADGTYINSGKLGTGATFTLDTGEIITVIIYGELTGEGNINSRDLKAVLNHLSGKELLRDASLIAADVDKDGFVTTKDALLIAGMHQ